MLDSQPRVRTLFLSDLIHVFDYRCTGHDDKGEIPQGFEIVLPRAGANQRRDERGAFLADPNHILFYNMGEPYDITHLIKGEDSSTVFIIAPSRLTEMMRAYNPHVENNLPGYSKAVTSFSTRICKFYNITGRKSCTFTLNTLPWW